MPKLAAASVPPLAAPLILAAASAAAPAPAAVLGPYAADCAQASRPAMLVRVSGLKSRTGLIRVQSYGGDPASYFAKGAYLTRVEVAPPAAGPIEVCVPVPRAGTYAVSVRHDVNGSGHSDMGDGGGMSGNPDVSLMDVLFKRRPSPAQVAVRVEGLTRVPVVLNYVQGGSVRPIASLDR